MTIVPLIIKNLVLSDMQDKGRGMHLQNLALELGGKAPFIVFDATNIDAASAGAVSRAVVNSGQDCIAAI